MGRRILNDALRTIVNAEKRAFASAEINPISNVMASFLRLMKFRGYIKDFQVHDPQRVGRITVELLGRVKDCRALTYRQDIKSKDIENYKTRALPTRQICSSMRSSNATWELQIFAQISVLTEVLTLSKFEHCPSLLNITNE